MALKVKAVERKIKFTKDENDPGVYRYVVQPDLYIALNQAKVIREAVVRRVTTDSTRTKALFEIVNRECHTNLMDLTDLSFLTEAMRK